MTNQSFKKNIQSNKNLFNYKINELSKNSIKKEVLEIVNSKDFIDFIETLDYTLEDNATIDDFFSSKLVLKKALEILKEIKLRENKKE